VHKAPPSALHALPGLDQPFSATLGVLGGGGDNVRTPVRMLLPCGQSLDRWPAFVTVSSCAVDDLKYMCAGTGNNILYRTLLCVVLELRVGTARGGGRRGLRIRPSQDRIHDLHVHPMSSSSEG
jgi:hypothetical protein